MVRWTASRHAKKGNATICDAAKDEGIWWKDSGWQNGQEKQHETETTIRARGKRNGCRIETSAVNNIKKTKQQQNLHRIL